MGCWKIGIVNPMTFMPVVNTRAVLSGMRVKEAMRRQMISLDGATPIATGIGRLIRYKADAGRFEGMLNYGDILGSVFQICRRCRKNRLYKFAAGDDNHRTTESTVSDVMTSAVISCNVTVS